MKIILLLTLICISSIKAFSGELANKVPFAFLDSTKAVTKNQKKYSDKKAQSVIELLSRYKDSFAHQKQDCRMVEDVMMGLEPSKVLIFQNENKESKAVSFSLFVMTKDYSVLQVSQEVAGKPRYWTSADKKMIKQFAELLTSRSVTK